VSDGSSEDRFTEVPAVFTVLHEDAPTSLYWTLKLAAAAFAPAIQPSVAELSVTFAAVNVLGTLLQTVCEIVLNNTELLKAETFELPQSVMTLYSYVVPRLREERTNDCEAEFTETHVGSPETLYSTT
jgi:hypothetical protein